MAEGEGIAVDDHRGGTQRLPGGSIPQRFQPRPDSLHAPFEEGHA
jgi:hypothetical protein